MATPYTRGHARIEHDRAGRWFIIASASYLMALLVSMLYLLEAAPASGAPYVAWLALAVAGVLVLPAFLVFYVEPSHPRQGPAGEHFQLVEGHVVPEDGARRAVHPARQAH